MAELAAKIRAKFRRRHSAIPGIPSLLSRTSIRSSAGSHGSSLFRPASHSHISGSSTNRDPDEDHADGDGASRVGSSRVSADDDEPDQLKDADGGGITHLDAYAEDDSQPEARGLSATAVATTADDELGGVVVRAGATEAAHEDDSGQAQQHNECGPTETSSFHSCIVSSSALALDDSCDTCPPNNGLPTDVDHCPSAATGISSLAVPAVPAHAPPQPPLTVTSSSDLANAASTVSTGRTIPADPESLQQQPSVMPGKDRQAALRKLSIVNEQPSPADNDDIKASTLDDAVAADVPPTFQPPSFSQATTLASSTDTADDTLDPDPPLPKPATVAPTVTATAPIPAVATPISTSTSTSTSPAKKRDDARLRPLLLTAPRTPSLGSLTPSRPLHIHLPPASFGGPNPNLSPGAAQSYASNTAPTSPLRHFTLAPSVRPAPARRQSLLANRQTTLIQTLLSGSQSEDPNASNTDQLLSIDGNMVTRKIWVKRPGASATLVTINEDDLVDDVREMILRKYANSLGRQFDAPDLTLRLRPNGNQQERMLGPEEPMSRTLDAYFPSGQTIDEALVIDVPLRRTPRASPRVGPPHAPHIQYYVDDPRPPETAGDYFGPGAVSALPVTVTAPSAGSGHSHAISVLSTGQVPQIPSPGGRRARDYRERPERPRLGRQHTSSPTLINLASGAAHQGPISSAAIIPHGMHNILTNRPPRSRTHSEASDASQAAPQPPPLPTPPPVESASAVPQRVATPPPRVASPRPKKSKKKPDHPMLPKGMLNGTVPPINVLIVEDNIINLKLLEAFVKRLKVRWSTAMNGRDAVVKWRAGGFHLVLMDIQLPIMSGLDATREIRRLERVNSIGVFSSAASSAPEEVKGEPEEKDRLENKDLFKSPVIIVALTASSLQSDRHEALAAGCNDFLTKPVNFVWLERKVMEWGCMQALIDFDGWRKWKDFSVQQVDDRAAKAAALKAKAKKNRSSLTQAIAAGA